MLTQLTTIKSRLGLELFDPTEDALLTNILKHVSARFAVECNRVFDYATELKYEFRAEELFIVVDRPPIDLLSEFHLKTTEAEGWVLQSSVDYLISPAKSVIELAEAIGSQGQIARVTYSGGFVLPGNTPSGSQRSLPDEIEQACIEQVVYWYQRRAQLGLTSATNDAGVVQQYQSSDLLPQARAVLRRHQRWRN